MMDSALGFQSHIFRRIAKELVVLTLGISSVMTMLVWLQQSYRFLRHITAHQLPFLKFLNLISLLLPHLLSLALPPALFLAVFLVFKSRGDGKIEYALESFGLSPGMLLKPVVFASIFFMAVGWFISLYFAPLCLRNLRASERQIRQQISQKIIQEKEFVPLGPFVIYAEQKLGDRTLRGISIFEKKKSGEEIFFLADQASIHENKGAFNILMEEGVKKSCRLKKCTFARFNSYEFSFEKEQVLQSAPRKMCEFSTRDLFRRVRGSGRSLFLIEGYQRVFMPMLVLMAGFLSFVSFYQFFGQVPLLGFLVGGGAMSIFYGLIFWGTSFFSVYFRYAPIVLVVPLILPVLMFLAYLRGHSRAAKRVLGIS